MDLSSLALSSPDRRGYQKVLGVRKDAVAAGTAPTPELLQLLPGVRVEGGVVLVPCNLTRIPSKQLIAYGAKTPSGLALRDYQVDGVQFIEDTPRGCVLGLDVGLGKCAITLEWLHLHPELRPFVVIGPLVASNAWVGENADPAKHFGMNVLALQTRTPAAPPPADGYFLNYQILTPWKEKLVNEDGTPQLEPDGTQKVIVHDAWFSRLLAMKPRVVVVDECHEVRNFRNTYAKAVHKLCQYDFVEKRIFLSATPVVNKVVDLWHQLDAVQPKLWGFYVPYNPRIVTSFGTRYCFAAGTTVLNGDWTAQTIETIRVGDTVIGFERGTVGRSKRQDATYTRQVLCRATVTEIHRHVAELWRVKLSDGTEILQTRDHRWFNTTRPPAGRGEVFDEYQPTRVGRLFRRLPVDENSARACTKRYREGWLRGVMDGDGYTKHVFSETGLVRGHSFKVILGQSVKNIDVLDRAETFAQSIGWTTRRGEEDSAKISRVYFKSGKSGRIPFQFFRGDWPPHSDTEFWRGWLAGMYDAEGSGATISQSATVNPEKTAQIKRALELFGFTPLPIRERRHQMQCVGWTISGGVRELRRFVALTQPVAHVRKTPLLYRSMQTTPVKVVAFEPTGIFAQVFNIATTTGNYFAEGFASKNCNGNHNGYGWDCSGESNTGELRSRLANVLIRRSRFDVRKELPPFERQRVAVAPAALDPAAYRVYLEIANATKEALRIAGGGVLQGHDLQRLTGMFKTLSWSKRHVAVTHAETLARSTETRKLLVFVWFKESARFLVKALKAKKLHVYGPVTGDSSISKRNKDAEAFRDLQLEPGGASVFVATLGAAGQSLNPLAAASAVLFVDLFWTPNALLQAEGRVHREGQRASTVLAQYLCVAGSVDDLMFMHLERKAKQIANATGDAAAMTLCETLGGVNEEDSLRALVKAMSELAPQALELT